LEINFKKGGIMKYYFTSDCHFNHNNIIGFCNRPFKDYTQMNETIIRNWNSIVKPEDTVFHIGDFIFYKGKESPEGTTKAIAIQDQLNGTIIHIEGNHDKNNTVKAIIRSCIIKLGGMTMFLVHNPEYANKRYPINLVGHVHEQWLTRSNGKHSMCINVGMDMHNFRPIDVNTILKIYNKNLKGVK